MWYNAYHKTAKLRFDDGYEETVSLRKERIRLLTPRAASGGCTAAMAALMADLGAEGACRTFVHTAHAQTSDAAIVLIPSCQIYDLHGAITASAVRLTAGAPVVLSVRVRASCATVSATSAIHATAAVLLSSTQENLT